MVYTLGEAVKALGDKEFEKLKNMVEEQPALISERLKDAWFDEDRPERYQPDSENTLLLKAIEFDCPIDIIEYLLDKGSDMEAKNFLGFQALSMAMHQRNKAVMQLLIQRGAIVQNAFHYIATIDWGETGEWTTLAIEEFIKKSGVDEKDVPAQLLDIKDETNCTPLLLASRSNNLGAVKVLLKYGADTSIKNNDGEVAAKVCDKNGPVAKLLAAHKKH